jgi:glycosyltransferase involved in cell wall biosynthesis
MISCHLPTTSARRRFLPLAIRCFLEQTYADRELVVLDDGEETVADLIPDDRRIRYFYEPPHLALGAKRERMCHLSHGDIFAQWDDDDWSAPTRLERQAAALLPGKECCLLDPYVLYDWKTNKAATWTFRRTLDGPALYTRTFWQAGGGFQNLEVEAAMTFILSRPREWITRVDGRELFVALRHGSNACQLSMRGTGMVALDPAPYAKLFER